MKLFSTLTPATKSLNHNILIDVCQPAWKECLTISLLLFCTRVCFSEILICKMAMVPWLNYFCNSKNVIITYLYLKQYCIFEDSCLLGCGCHVIWWMVPDFLKDNDAFNFKDHPLTHCHIPEDLNPQQLFCENIKSHSIIFDDDKFDITGLQFLVLWSICGL